MKKTWMLSLVLSFCLTELLAQTNTFPSTGNAGIGTTSPSTLLHIHAPAISGQEEFLRCTISDAPNDFLKINNATTVNSAFTPTLWGHNSAGRIGLYYMASAGVSTGSNPVMAFNARVYDQSTSISTAIPTSSARPCFQFSNLNDHMMSMLPNGDVVVGNASFLATAQGVPSVMSGYKLIVQTGILTEKIKIATSGTADWADYVFDKNYRLRPLNEVEQYINEHHHLPDVPSAEEVNENGIDVLKMDATLLQKIEEITLYMIQLKKENEELRKQQQELTEKLNTLQAK